MGKANALQASEIDEATQALARLALRDLEAKVKARQMRRIKRIGAEEKARESKAKEEWRKSLEEIAKEFPGGREQAWAVFDYEQPKGKGYRAVARRAVGRRNLVDSVPK